MKRDPSSGPTFRSGPAVLRLFLVLSVFLLLTVPGDAAHHARPEAAAADQGLSSLSVSIRNDYVSAVQDSDGTFVIGSTGGDPSTPEDDNRRLLYGYPDWPWSSFTTVRVVTNGEVRDFDLRTVAPVQPPTKTGRQIVTTWSTWMIEVQQTLKLERNPYSGRDDTVRIEYSLVNRDTEPHDVGVRVMLDVMIGGNDGAPYLIPGTGNQTTEVEYLGSDVPAFWQGFESPTFDPLSLKGLGILSGEEATAPDRFVIARWPAINNTEWAYAVTPGESVTEDSATALYWNPIAVAPGESRTVVTYYGLAGPGGGDAWFVAPTALTCDDLSFDAVLRVSNISTSHLRGGSATISLPRGLVLALGEEVGKRLGDVAPGETASISWRVLADRTITGQLVYSAEVTFSSGSIPVSAEASIHVPYCADTPTPTPTVTTTPTPRPTGVPRCLRWVTAWQDEFTDRTLSLWQVDWANGSGTVEDSVLHLKGIPGVTFPLLWAQLPPLEGDYAVEVRFRYGAPTRHGTTVGICTADYDGTRYHEGDTPPPGIEDVLSIHKYEDAFRVTLRNRLRWDGSPDDTSWHIVRIEHERGRYELTVDGALIGSAVVEGSTPKSVFLGNPTIQRWSSAWTPLDVDYIRVQECEASGSDRAHLPLIVKG